MIATVKGDVHDIAKKYCLFEVVNIDAIVPRVQILAKAKEENADIVGLSSLSR